ncbi:chemotaxis protein methyltransferase [Abditibacteriota bacterium]|nr:chemotaxis protein methyltransferase [Abditibacteriota bacterium]
MLTSLDDASLQAFCELLGARTGLQVRDKDRASVARALADRCEALRMTATAYLQKLRIDKVDGVEWVHLMPLLTNGESYFERDKGQFTLIRDTILPELIERRRGTGDQTLRLWSAGCSTGEEVYSLAMATEAVLMRGWKATILGTDINAEALKKARRGVYGAWSFRGVETATRDHFFRAVPGGFEVAASLRGRVTFEFCNLSADDWPDTERGIADIDLIVCRNVLIYFQRAVVAGVLSRFARTLRPGGFLLTGHAELHDQSVAPLKARLFPASAAYQKEGEAPSSIVPPHPPGFTGVTTPLFRPVTPRLTPTGTGSLLTNEQTVKTPTLRPSISRPSASPPIASKPKTADEWCALAQRHADSGRYNEAVECCRNAIGIDPSRADAYLLWAQIAEEREQLIEAKELLKKVIYLTPEQAEAYVQLAAIYEREGNTARARQMRVSALKLLQSLAAPSENDTELKRHVQELLGEGDNSTSSGGRR